MLRRAFDRKTGLILIGLQTIFTVALFLIATHGNSADVSHDGAEPLSGLEYAMFQNGQVIIFLGIGLLMAYPKRYMHSSLGFSFLMGTLAVQYGLICSALLEPLTIDNQRIVGAEASSVPVFISLGAIHGRVSILQQIILVLLETPTYTANLKIMRSLQVTDTAGGVELHLFGAYFGLAAAKMLGSPKTSLGEESSYISDVISIIGTLSLWIYWPSFNSYSYVTIDGQQRSVVNTYLALAASCVTAVAFSLLINTRNKLNMSLIQNATLAGGVAISSSADLMIGPWVAGFVGTLAGIICVLGLTFAKPTVDKKIGLHDTCGIRYLHGLPSLFGGLVAVLFSWTASSDGYGSDLYKYFPARAPSQEALGTGRTAASQSGHQFLWIVLTLSISTVSGAFTGLVMRLCSENERKIFLDDVDWDIEARKNPSNERRSPHAPRDENREMSIMQC